MDEKLWNLIRFHFYGTNDELEQFAPVGLLIIVIGAVVFGIYSLLN